MTMLTMALPKGRLLAPSVELLERLGVTSSGLRQASRRLVFNSDDGRYRFLIAKPLDVPTYVEYGMADVGIVGSDVLAEVNCDVHEPLDLRFGRCTLVLAERRGADGDPLATHTVHRVATKYPNVTQRYFARRGIQVETIKLYGSVELAPLSGLSEMIVDPVETGATLSDNGLDPRAVIAETSARLIVNRASHKIHLEAISDLVAALSEAVTC